MQLKRVVAVTVALIHSSLAADLSWTACPTSNSEAAAIISCAIYPAPLCHRGICEAPDTANSTVDVFVTRIQASKDPETAPNVWLLQGAPDYTEDAMLRPMAAMYTKLKRAANIYTMDHRGIGSGTKLTCNDGKEIEPAQVPECAQSLAKQYGNLAAFSTTSAATDLATFISKYGNGASTTVYGVGYGTLWVERLLHLAPPDVTGYVMDGVLTTSGASPKKFPYLSSSDTGFGEVGDAFLELCTEDSKCNAHFKKKGIKATLEHSYKTLDAKPDSKCAKLVKNARKNDNPPSDELRYVLGRRNTSVRSS